MVSYPVACGPYRSMRFPSPGLKLSNSTSTSTSASGWVCPPCFSTVGPCTATGMLQLPFSSITEEFKVGKARLHLMLRDSPDDVIRQVQPEVRTGTKWSAAKAVQEAGASLQIKEVIGATQTGRAGLGSTPHRWFSREDSRGSRDMVITELKMIEEEKKVATAAGQAKQCAWMNWEEAEARKLSWSSLMTMEPLALSFLLRSTYNHLPTPANHKQWGFTGDDTCAMCKSARATLRHVLSSCGSSLQMYTCRHNRVLAILAEITETQCRVANEQPTQDPKPCISFLQEGEAPPRQVSKPQGQKFLAAAKDWHMAADLKEARHLPRNDQTLWYGLTQSSVSSLWSWLYHGRRTWKKPSRERNSGTRIYAWTCEDEGWACQVMPIEVGCRGFIGRTTTSYLTRLGLTNRARRRATQQLQTAAERASSWIWSKVRKSTTVWQNRPPSSLLPYPHPTPPQPYPSPTLSLPPPTTSIPIPSSAYRASRSTCSPQWHHPVAEAAGGARVWGTTGSRRNHLTRSGRWLTRVMSRQLLLHVVCIYFKGAWNSQAWKQSSSVKIWKDVYRSDIQFIFSFTSISDVYSSFILNITTFTCFTQCIEKVPESFEIHKVRQCLDNFTGLAGIVNAKFTRPRQFSQFSAMSNCRNC